MKFIAIFALFGMCMAAPPRVTGATTGDAEAHIIEEGSKNVAEYFIPTGYDYGFRSSNSITKNEVADLGKQIVTGEYSYISPEDDQTIRVTYTAGAGIGFFPRSEIIPNEIIEAIELNLKNPPEDSKKK